MSGIETAIGIATLASGAMSTANSYAQAQAQARAAQQQADYRRQMAEYNAHIAEQEADIERRLGEKRQRAIREQGESQSGMLRSRMARSGVSLLDEDGSPMDLLGQVAADYAAEAENDAWETENAVNRLRHKAQLYRHNGLLAGLEGSSAASAYRRQGLQSLSGNLLGLTNKTLSYFK